MNSKKDGKKNNNTGEFTRRDLVKYTGVAVVGIGILSCENASDKALQKIMMLESKKTGAPASEGYLLVDIKKCQGCMTCMLACSLVHEGRENLSLSRIQVIQNPFEKFPVDIRLEQCRQCVSPACLKSCPTGALHVDEDNGNIRMIDEKKCIGCKSCVEACPYKPGGAIWNYEEKRARMCDLCSNTPYWDEHGGPGGLQACVAVCPVGAIKFTSEIPLQKGNAGYKVNLRGESWEQLGYSID